MRSEQNRTGPKCAVHKTEPVPNVQCYKNITKILSLYYKKHIMLILEEKRGKIKKDSI